MLLPLALEFQRVANLRFGILADLDDVVSRDLRRAIQEENAVDHLLGVNHFLD